MADVPPGVTPDVIELRGLRVVGICGALPEERERPQPLEIDLDVEADLSAAGWSDDLGDTIDYGALCDVVVGVVDAGDPQLLEHLAAFEAVTLVPYPLVYDGRWVIALNHVSSYDPNVTPPANR